MTKKTNIQRKSTKYNNIKELVIGLLIIIAVNFLGSSQFYRIDMTAEKRYTLTDATKKLINDIDDVIYFRVYLEGNFPAEFRKLRNETREMLDEFSAYSGYIQYDFVNPSSGDDQKQVEAKYHSLMRKGLQPTQLDVREVDATSQRVIFPGAIVSYKGREVPINILHSQMGRSEQETITNSVQALEYKIASAIRILTADKKPKIAFLDGYDKIPDKKLADINNELLNFYDIFYINLEKHHNYLDSIKTLIIADPVKAIPEEDKFLIDQYIMRGGTVLWLVNPIFADMDSLNHAPQTIGMAKDLNIDDMLFKYGVRLNANLIQDLRAVEIPITTGFIGNRPQIDWLPWVFYPIVSNADNHPIVKNLNAIRTEFISSMDTVKAKNVKKTKLLKTSPYTRVLRAPVPISLDIIQNPLPEELYNEQRQTVAVLLEGQFESLYKNRPHPINKLPSNHSFKEKSEKTSQIVVSDGSIIQNQISRHGGHPLPLGYDQYTQDFFENRDFILNAINYLADDTGIIEARAKEIRLRELDKRRIQQSRLAVQTFNVIIPIVIVIIFGLLKNFVRKIKYSKKK